MGKQAYYRPRTFKEPWNQIFKDAKLTPLQIGIIDYYYWDEFSPELIGQTLGYEPKAVKAMLKKAQSKLSAIGITMKQPKELSPAYEVCEFPFSPADMELIDSSSEHY